MGMCCHPTEEQSKSILVTKSVSKNQQEFLKQFNIEVSNEQLSQKSFDLLIILTDNYKNLDKISFIKKLPQPWRQSLQLNIKQNIQNLKQGDLWEMIKISNPVFQLDISQMLIVHVPIWNGQDHISKILLKKFQDLKNQINKVQNIGFIQPSSHLGIPSQKCIFRILQVLYLLGKEPQTLKLKKMTYLCSNQNSMALFTENVKKFNPTNQISQKSQKSDYF